MPSPSSENRSGVRRWLWWKTLPYYGWVFGGDGGEIAPWYAYPVAWLHRFVNWTLRKRSVFGPRYESMMLTSPRRFKPWQ